MTVTTRGSTWKGSEARDLDEYLRAFAAGGYPVVDVVHAMCAACGTSAAGFSLTLDDEEGAAVRTCLACRAEVPMLDSAELPTVVQRYGAGMTSGFRIRALAGSLLMGVLLSGCGGDPSEEDSAAPVPDTEQSMAATEASPEVASAGTVAMAPPSCEDADGDSAGAVDLASVTVFQTPDSVIFGYTYTGTLPTSGSLLLVASDGSKQYGYKSVNGQKSGHFVFNFADAQQENVEADAEVGVSEAKVSFPRAAVDVEKLAGGTATINVGGDDVDQCRLE